VFIKHFPESNYYSVRSGPYNDRAQAEKDQKKLDQMLNIESQLVRISPNQSGTEATNGRE
jgi:cell division protein FtsN